jgi:large subunit ribosomal protein L16
MTPEVATAAMKLAQAKLPVLTKIVSRSELAL